MAVVDATYRFVFVNIGAYGRCCDSSIFSDSAFGRQLEDGSIPIPDGNFLPETSMRAPCVLLVDEGFPLRNNIMRPFPVCQMDHDKRIFNYRLSRGRRTVENVFGIMSARFRIETNRSAYCC